jgi:hypothetical protein
MLNLVASKFLKNLKIEFFKLSKGPPMQLNINKEGPMEMKNF